MGFDYRTYTGLRKQTIGGHKQNLVSTRRQEKGAVTPQETDPDLSLSVQESWVEAYVSSGLLQGLGHWVWQLVHEIFWRRSPLSSLPPPQFVLRSNREPHPSTENWIKDLLSMAPAHHNKTQFPPQSSLPSESFHKLLILIHQSVDRMKTITTEN